MDRFVSAENIERYRALATTEMSAEERLEVIQSLAQEMNKFREELQIVCDVGKKDQIHVTKEMSCRPDWLTSPSRHQRCSTETLSSPMMLGRMPSRALR
jgi:hypothetical protein